MKLKKLKFNKKGQIWALDLAIGLMVFIAIIFMFYRYSVSFVPEQTTVEKMIKQAGTLSESLIKEGYPPAWDEGNLEGIYSFGLITNQTLDKDKWKNFCDWSESNYIAVKEKLGIDSSFGFYIYVDNNNQGPPYEINGETHAGTIVSESAKQSITVERLILYENGAEQIIPLKLIVTLWSYSSV